MQTQKIDGVIHVQPDGADRWYKMECLTEEGKRAKVIQTCIYSHVCAGSVGQQVPTCLRWRRKTRKPNTDPNQLSLA